MTEEMLQGRELQRALAVEDDANVRLEVLDPFQNFIVQAPAGSGKTELLTQRILRLLAEAVETPEQVLAITFTQKAALEMSERVVKALNAAQNLPEPEREPARNNWLLARAVLKKDAVLNWGLLANPKQLNIRTIDAFCADLVRQSPGHLSEIREFHDQPAVLYRKAALQTLERLSREPDHRPAVEGLLTHFDYRLEQLVRMLSSLLASRDQWMPLWLPYWGQPDALKGLLEQSLQDWIQVGLRQALKGYDLVRSLYPEVHALSDLLTFARQQLQQVGLANLKGDGAIIAGWQEKSMAGCQESGCQAWSEHPEQLAQWQALACLLLTSTGEWRKPRGVNKNIGFPTPPKTASADEKQRLKEHKKRFQDILTLFSESESQCKSDSKPESLFEAWRHALVSVRQLPKPELDEVEWQELYQLITLLPQAVAELDILMAETNSTDFVAMGLAALNALRESETSGLAYQLDKKIRHVLVDEFQDTSVTQFELLRLLTQFWPGSEVPRSLFLVGDPMQSIYRFRQADVGLFLTAKDSGIGEIQLNYRRLTRNFRADARLVHWVNQHFSTLFPADDVWWQGAISFAQAQAGRPARVADSENSDPQEDSAVQWALSTSEDQHLEDLLATIQADDQRFPEQTKAVLVRNRRHAQQVLRVLKQHSLPVHAIEIERLVDLPMTQDLLALSEAILYPHLDLAWAGVLRAPWVGIALMDLQKLCDQKTSLIRTVSNCVNSGFVNSDSVNLDCVNKTEPVTAVDLSEDAINRLTIIWPVLSKALFKDRNMPIEERVHMAWQAFNGAAFYPEEKQCDSALFFQLLGKLRQQNLLQDPSMLRTRVSELFASQITEDPQESARQPIQIMTIHKSKGLEFDRVYLPFLDKRPRAEDAPLLRWAQFYFPHNEPDGGEDREGWLLAMLPKVTAELPNKAEGNRLYSTIQTLEKLKSQYEVMRLFYVAVTRAKCALHLFGCLQPLPDESAGAEVSTQEGSGQDVSVASVAEVVEEVEDVKAVPRYRMPPQQSLLGLFFNSLDDQSKMAYWESVKASSGHAVEDNEESSFSVRPWYRAQTLSVKDEPSRDVSNAPYNQASNVIKDVQVADRFASTLGTLWHELLSHAATETQLRTFFENPHYGDILSTWLQPHALRVEQQEKIITLIGQGIEVMLSNDIGRWLLQGAGDAVNERTAQQEECAILGGESGQQWLRVDKTFIEAGVRWIVDYKMVLAPKPLPEVKAQYEHQLAGYAKAYEPQGLPIKLGLYLPLTGEWVSW